MWVEQMVTECDFSDEVYDTPVKGGGVIARGATGRYCVVMWAGPSWLKRNGVVPMSPEKARDAVAELGDGYPDF